MAGQVQIRILQKAQTSKVLRIVNFGLQISDLGLSQ